MNEENTQNKYGFRGHEVTPTRIDCPKHGLQKSYLLYQDDETRYVSAIGCCKCFAKLKPTKRVEEEVKKYSEKDLLLERQKVLQEVREKVEAHKINILGRLNVYKDDNDQLVFDKGQNNEVERVIKLLQSLEGETV